MKKYFICFSLALLQNLAFAQGSKESKVEAIAELSTEKLKEQVNIIPIPYQVNRLEGVFKFPKNIMIQLAPQADLMPAYKNFTEHLGTATGINISTSVEAIAGAQIVFELNKTKDASLGDEGYSLMVHPQQIKIKANKAAGLFYGMQSLLQLMPPQIESKTLVEGLAWEIPCVEIKDKPKLGWRGLMFDVARHHFTKEEVKKFIDNMSKYKFNLLHLHLTDDEGWRIEIKGLPKLTEVGAWRVNRVGTFGNFSKASPEELRNYGGFYTQEDIKEIVKYAQERFVNIMPEIDVPGHSLAAVVSYPELSCTPDAVNYNVRAGEQIMDWSRGAPPVALIDNTLCPANEKVYAFLDTVITQIAQLFPFEYIHMGGDEAPRNFWEKTPAIKELMKRENLKTIPQVQAYFTKRVEKIVNAKGKKFMGWDEILEGGIEPSAGIMSWRGLKYGIESSKLKHPTVMSPTDFAYLDYMQADVSLEPRVYASLRLSRTYEFDPLPAAADPKYILGAQGNLWTEQIYNIRQVEYMVWPRGFAVAESAWSPQSHKDWKNFVQRTENHFERFDYAETKYAKALYDPMVSVKKAPMNQILIDLSTEVEGLDIHYSFDNSTPDYFYPKYTEALSVPKDASLLKVITYKDKKPMGRLMNLPIDELRKRAK